MPTINELTPVSGLSGAEQFPFAIPGGNGRASLSQIAAAVAALLGGTIGSGTIVTAFDGTSITAWDGTVIRSSL